MGKKKGKKIDMSNPTVPTNNEEANTEPVKPAVPEMKGWLWKQAQWWAEKAVAHDKKRAEAIAKGKDPDSKKKYIIGTLAILGGLAACGTCYVLGQQSAEPDYIPLPELEPIGNDPEYVALVQMEDESMSLPETHEDFTVEHF